MKMINGVSMIPFGLLAGFADQNEIRIIELAENGFRFRMAKNKLQNLFLRWGNI